RLHRFPVLGQEGFLDPRDQALVGDVDALDLDLRGFLVEQVVELFFRELLYRLVRVEETAAAEDPAVPAVHAVPGDGEGAFVERQVLVVEGGEVEIGNRTAALTARAHTAEDAETAAFPDGLPALFHSDRARAADRGDVEGERLR